MSHKENQILGIIYKTKGKLRGLQNKLEFYEQQLKEERLKIKKRYRKNK